MAYKILHDLCPENFRDKFTERSMISEYRTRKHGDLQIPKVRFAKRSFYFSGVKNWNDILDNIREKDSVARFRTGLCWGDEIRLTDKTNMSPRAVGQSSCARLSFNPKPLLRMSYNLLHGGHLTFLGQSISGLPNKS